MILSQRVLDVHSGDCGIYAESSDPTCLRNLVVHSVNFGIACFGDPLPILDCNDVFDSGTTNYSSSCSPGESDFHADALFCDEVEFGLSEGSPCLGQPCGPIGAVGRCPGAGP